MGRRPEPPRRRRRDTLVHLSERPRSLEAAFFALTATGTVPATAAPATGTADGTVPTQSPTGGAQ